MQPNDLSLIPKAHLPGAVEAATLGKTAGNVRGHQDASLLLQLQKQLNYLMGVADESREDLVMVNPHGRIIEVAGQYVDEWINKPGFRKATSEEEANYRKAIIRQTPEYLRRREKKRLQDQEAFLSSVEAEEASEPEGDLLRTKVTDAQKTGALTPDEVKALPKSEAQHAADVNDTTEPANQTADRPAPSRRRSAVQTKPQADGPTAEDIANV